MLIRRGKRSELTHAARGLILEHLTLQEERCLMSQREPLYPWVEPVAQHFPQLSKPQAFVLAAFSFGLALARRCTLSAIAQALAILGKPDSVERRLQRFLANEQVSWPAGAQALSRWVFQHCSAEVIVLLVDETSLQERLKVMAVSLAYRGRALPLAWR